MNSIRKTSHYVWIAVAVALFVLFWMISVKTPLAGDDWGYALNGMNNNPLAMAWEFYFTWSGRFFSELWGFLIAPRKELWNMLNPLLWTGIYILIYAIVNPRRNRAAVALLIAAMMLTVKDWVRMETYTWIMGTTYVIPLFLILIVIWIEKQVLLQGQRFSIVHVIVVAVLNFVIGMTMENIAAGSIVLGVLASLYAWFRRREALKLTLTGLAVSVIAFVLMRLSPGSAYRLMSEHQAWTQLGLFQQIQTNWGNFLTYTFTDNKMMMLFLSGIAALALLHHLLESDHLRGSQIALFVVQETILALAVVACCAQFLQAHTQIAALSLFYDHAGSSSAMIFCSVLYILYIVNLFSVLFVLYRDRDLMERSGYLILAGTCNLAMLLSPIFGARSSLYTIYFIILLSASMLSQIETRPAEPLILVMICGALCATKALQWHTKYNQVAQVQQQREAILQYYREHPEDEEAWIPRMPPMSIHSADIEEGDDYHMRTFKEYYGLPESTTLIFYYLDNYADQ